MKIKVLGPGCKKCHALEQEVRAALTEMGYEAEVEKIEDMDKIVDAGIMLTPGLIINDNLKVMGKVPKRKDIIKYIEEEK